MTNEPDRTFARESCCCGCQRPIMAQLGTHINRRQFMFVSTTAALTAAQVTAETGAVVEPRVSPIYKPLRVQPVFNCHIYQRQPQTSWRVTGAINDEAEMEAEENRLRQELKELAQRADFPLEIRPLVRVENVEQAASVAQGDFDATLIFAARRNVPVLEALAKPERWNLMFVRHRSGPLYYMYIGAHVHYLRKRRDFFAEPAMNIHDVVVDDYDEVLWRLRALSALKNTLGKKFVCIGGPAGWGAEGNFAPQIATKNWKFEYVVVPYEELGKRIEATLADPKLVRHCEHKARDYVRQAGVTVEIPQESVDRAFVLTEVFLRLLEEAQTDAITVHNCMTTIMPVSGTTACLPLTLLNDAGLLAFCESDFVAIPAGVLMRYIADKPAFFCNPSWPHRGVVTVSHCTAPRRMNGRDLDPVRLLTHYESDFGAATKVEMQKGEWVTVVDADFGGKRWLGFEAQIIDTPFFPICRTQLDLAIAGPWERLIEEIRGFHWIVVYGRYLREAGYAVRKAGLDWLAIA
ncbi:MAG: hypothetical protein NZ899_05635 [Thermoguttaceae bacterium]|nr:hypothetical protein [Thermoguttaceae bacterium]MDW8079422.1 hypothetical protein [Thermoguttaceae bacterium]